MAITPSWPVIAMGQYGINVRALQLLLKQKGYNINADGDFGQLTKNAVISFQSSHGLTADGEAGGSTLAALIVTISSRTINFAAHAAQYLLSKFENLTIDGDFYTGSAAATSAFQTNMGISATGTVDSLTWQYLFGYYLYPGTGNNTTTAYSSICVTNSTLSNAQMGMNAGYVYHYLTNAGFTKAAACAVLGNMEKESGINPGIWQTSSYDTTEGFGIVQWDPATVFLNRATSQGVISAPTAQNVNNLTLYNPKALMDAELECFLWCCDSSNPNVYFFAPYTGSSMDHTHYYFTFEQFKLSTIDVSTLAIAFHDHYERSNDSTYQLSLRGARAAYWYKAF